MEMKIHLLVLSLTSLILFHPTSAICVKRNASMQQFGPSIARPVAPPATQSGTLSTPQSSQPLQSDPAKSLEAQKNQQPETQPSTPDQTPQTQQSTTSQTLPTPQSSQPLQSDPAKSLEAQKNQQPETQPSTPDQTPQTQQSTTSQTLPTPQSSQPLQSDPAKSLEAQKNQQPQTQPSTPDQTLQTQQSTPSQPQPVQPPLPQQTTTSPAQPVQTPPTQRATPSPTQSAQPSPTQETTPVQPLLSQKNTPAPAKSDQPPLTQQVQPTSNEPHDGLGQPAPLDSPDGPVPSTPTNPPAQPALPIPLDSPDGPVQPTPVDSPDGPVPGNPVDSPDGPAPADGVPLSTLPFLNIPGITTEDPHPAEPSHGKESKGIQELCDKTDFPDVCMSLIPPNTNPDPASALRALINVGKEKAKAAKDASKKMSVNSPPDDMATSTLEVCHESYGDTITDFDSALKALDAHDNGTLMTMLSGALTSTGTCSDSFAELPGVVSPVAPHDDPITTLTRICLAFGDMMK